MLLSGGMSSFIRPGDSSVLPSSRIVVVIVALIPGSEESSKSDNDRRFVHYHSVPSLSSVCRLYQHSLIYSLFRLLLKLRELE